MRRASMPTAVAAAAACRAAMPRSSNNCQRLPRRAVRLGARHRLHRLPHQRPRPCRSVPAGAGAARPRRLRPAPARRRARRSARPPGRCVDCHTEHEGPQADAADAAAILRRLPHRSRRAAARHAGSPTPSDFERRHPEFQPSVLIRWDGEQPRMQRVVAGRAAARDQQPQIPARAASRPRPAASPRWRGGWRRSYGFGQQLECADCHVPTPDGARFQPVDMEGDCGMCHSLAFDRIGGTVRTLRHGEPRQVVADLRVLLPRRRSACARPSSAPARAAGRATSTRSAPPSSSRAAGAAARRARRAGDPGGLLARRRLLRLPPGGQPPAGIARLRHPPGRLPDPLHAARLVRSPRRTRSCSGRASAQLEGSAACLSCHARRRLDRRERPAAARPRQLPRLPWRRDDPTAGARRPARCAMIIIWTRACRRCCSASRCADGAGRRRSFRCSRNRRRAPGRRRNR